MSELSLVSEDGTRSSRRRTSTRPRRYGQSPDPPPSTSNSQPVTPTSGSFAGKQGRKRKRGAEDETELEMEQAKEVVGPGEAAAGGKQPEEEEEEEEDPVWNDFSAEYFEVVEQLPLELHRNFALLRELDDQTQRHTARLLELIRQYVSDRLQRRKVRQAVSASASISATDPPARTSSNVNQSGVPGGLEEGIAITVDLSVPLPALETLRTGAGEVSENSGIPDRSDPITGTLKSDRLGESSANDGADRIGGMGEADVEANKLELPVVASMHVNAEAGPSGLSRSLSPDLESSTVDVNGTGVASLARPVTSGAHGPLSMAPELALGLTPGPAPPDLENAEKPVPSTSSTQNDPAYSAFPPSTQAAMHRLSLIPPTRSLLPEIGRLAREMLRGADEKVGVATGVYNSVDRHIRALDVALDAQQVALNLGIREDTLPSNAIEIAGTAGAKGLDAIDGEGEMMIGSGGGAGVNNSAGGTGGAKRKGKKGRGRKKGKAVAEEAVEPGPMGGPVVVGQYDLKIDPYEPRYCYCGGYSFGVMIACDASDCPNGGWIHLACQGLAKPPPGAFFCNDCRPVKKKK